MRKMHWVFGLCVIVALVISIKPRAAQAGPRPADSSKAFAKAEEIYHRADYNKDGVLEYGKTLRATKSIDISSGDAGLIEKTFARAEGRAGEASTEPSYVFSAMKDGAEPPPSALASEVMRERGELGTEYFLAHGANVPKSAPEKVQPGLVQWRNDFESACKAAVKSHKAVLLFELLGRLDNEFC